MSYVLHLRGLPWTAEPGDVEEFLGVQIVGGKSGIHMTHLYDGRVSGECFVEVETESDLKEGLEKNKEYMGTRYIEVVESNTNKMEQALSNSSRPASDMAEPIVKLRGLPYGCTKEDIANFFSGLKIVPNGIVLLLDDQGKPTVKGIDAFVEFVNTRIAAQAMERHKQKIGHRYVEVFRSNQVELRMAIAKMEKSLDMKMGGGRSMGGWGNNSMSNYRGNMGMGGGRMGGNKYGDNMGMMGDDMMGGARNDIRSLMSDEMIGGSNRGMMGRASMNDMGMMGGSDMDMMGGGMGGNSMGMSGGMGGNRPGPYDRPGAAMMGGMGRNVKGFSDNGGSMGGINRRGMRGDSGRRKGRSSGKCVVTMRGMPYSANEDDITTFFKPLNIVNIQIKENNGKPLGKAAVEFGSHHEAKMAMTRDKANMQHRYIELFMDCDCEADEEDNGGNTQRMMGRMQERRGMNTANQMYDRGNRMMNDSGLGGGMQSMNIGGNMSDRGEMYDELSAHSSMRMRRGGNMDSMGDDYMGMRGDDMGGAMDNMRMGGMGNMDFSSMRGESMGMGNMSDMDNMSGRRMGGGGYVSNSARFTTKMLDKMAFGGRKVEGGLGNGRMTGNSDSDMRGMMNMSRGFNNSY